MQEKKRDREDPIIVVGNYRSGTSITAGVLHACGAWIGTATPANQHNPKGYFENEALKSLLHLMLMWSRYNDSDKLPPDDLRGFAMFDRFHYLLELAMRGDGYSGGVRVFKNTKIVLFWRYFHQVYPNAKWVIVRRDASKIVESLQRATTQLFWMHPK